MDETKIEPAVAAPEADTSTPPATPAEPTQEQVLADILAAEKEGRKQTNSFVPPPPTSGHEEELKKKHGDDYKPPEGRKSKVSAETIAREKEQLSKMNAMEKQLIDLQEKLKALTAPESANDKLKTELALQSIGEKYEEYVNSFRGGLQKELQEKYRADENFAKQADHYRELLNDIDGAREFNNAILINPHRIEILEKLYDWLDKDPAATQKFAAATSEQRLTALNMIIAEIKYRPRIEQPPTPPAAAIPPAAPAEPAAPTGVVIQSNGLPAIKDNVKPTSTGTGGKAGYDLNNQEDCLKQALELEKRKLGR